MNNESSKTPNAFIKFWRYFTTYEKCWWVILCGLGIIFAILFPEEKGWVRAFEIITLVGGCSCELLLAKQSKWAFIVSFFCYDLTQVVIYFVNGYYISALYEIIVIMPLLIITYFLWNKHLDKDNHDLTEVKKINWKRDVAIFSGVLAASFITGGVFTVIASVAEGLSDWWYLDALANTFSICNALFMLLRYKEQWAAWYGVIICETIMWLLTKNWIMLILQVGYITNSVYGDIKWSKYIKNKQSEADAVAQPKEKMGENTTAERK